MHKKFQSTQPQAHSIFTEKQQTVNNINFRST